MTEEVIKESFSINAVSEDHIKLNEEISNEDDAETQIYEVGFHIVPSIEETNLGKEVDIIKSLIEKNGGAFISEEFPKKTTLAYTVFKNIDGKIQKFDTAYFGWIKFEMKTDSILNVKEETDLNKNVLRYLIIKTVRESTLTPSTLVFAKDTQVNIFKKPKTKEVIEKKKKETTKNKQPTQAEKTSISEKELDKTIEDLLVD